MSTREKKVIDKNSYTKDDAEVFVSDYSKATSEIKKLEAKIELEKNKVNQKYESALSDLREEKTKAFDKLEVFALNNPELFEGKKSIAFLNGVVGFRTGQPKLVTSKGFTWPKVLDKVKTLLPDFVRTKPELDKEALLNQRNDPDMQAYFKKIGVEVTQDETFYVEPKTEDAQ